MHFKNRNFFIVLTLFISFYLKPFCQSNSGFLKGDKALVRFLEKELVNQEYKDTLTYHFTIAALKFDHVGNLDSIKFMTEGYLYFKQYLEVILLKTKTMWDTAIVKNRMLLIPFEILRIDKHGNDEAISEHRMLSYDFRSLFKQEYSLFTTIIRPITIIRFDPIRKYKN